LIRLGILALLGSSVLAAGSHLEDGIQLQQAGRLGEADGELRTAIGEYRSSGNRPNLVKALSLESWVSVSLGNYPDAIQQATEAVQLRRELGDEQFLANDLNTLALAYQNMGMYAQALGYFEQALRADRDVGDADGEITRHNNIGNVYYFEGRYFDALQSYELAKSKVDATLSQSWNLRRRQLTLANLATIYQRLGKEEMSLELYRTLAASPQAMPPRERAQLLLNQGTLYRRLGDPIKALDLYRMAQQLYAVEHYSDGEIGALRNIGIARAIDLADRKGALEAFDGALKLAQGSSNQRGIVQASLYRGEALRGLHRLDAAATDAESALKGAESAGLTEEEWRALYLLARIAEENGDTKRARTGYTDAIAVIESIRSGLQTASLRNEFLSDKRDVYDALINLRLEDHAQPEELFRLIEQSRARALNERVALGPFHDLRTIQSQLRSNSIVLDFWTGAGSVATVWITSTQAGIVRHPGRVQDSIADLIESVQNGNDRWRDASRILGSTLLSGLPLARHLIIIPDGPLSAFPFEILVVPGSSALLIEKSDISYLPSAQFLVRSETPRRTLLPWQRELVALGDPPVGISDALSEGWQRLRASRDEVRSIQRILPGRCETHLGVDAQKRYIAGGALENLPMLHFSTHALVDPDNPDRSRILLASDYLFQREVYDLDLKGVDLVTVSACDTARGKMVHGEGVQAFSRAFLAAGAASTVTSLWRVSDEPTADFMKQFYYFLAKGQAKSEALRSAKLEMLHSQSALASPRYWAAFVLTGDGLTPVPRAIPWSLLMLAFASILGIIAWIAYRTVKVVRPQRQKVAASTESHPR
jgi:tetratricopeptide (TPR) repeat protein